MSLNIGVFAVKTQYKSTDVEQIVIATVPLFV